MSEQIKLPLLDSQDVLSRLRARKNPFWPQYHAMYSTWFGGIVQNPEWMMVPMDDHMVHRGDAVFEAIKSVNRKVYLLKEHLQRLASSAHSIGLTLPFSVREIQDIILQTLQVADRSDTLIRLFVSRGPGGFTTNPYDSVASQLYVVITDLRLPKPELYAKGARIGRSFVPVKEAWMAQVKSCNYLPNVMMKKEAVDRQVDFTIGFDSQNFVTESSTENIAIIDEKGILTHPPFDSILRGTTMIRVFQLAKEAGLETAIRHFSQDEILRAQEVLMIGTTWDVLPVSAFEEKKLQQGPQAEKLLQWLRQDFEHGLPY